jgi:hypothetical protein
MEQNVKSGEYHESVSTSRLLQQQFEEPLFVAAAHHLLCLCCCSGLLVACALRQNAEFFALTYGALVVQLIQDFEDTAAVNQQLDTM